VTNRSYRYNAKLTAFVLLGLILGALVVPLQTRSGIIDTTRGQCPGLPPATKYYHVLLGQLHDYRLVRPHLVSGAAANHDCGQQVHLRLYL
jgi:hypothetical protein